MIIFGFGVISDGHYVRESDFISGFDAPEPARGKVVEASLRQENKKWKVLQFNMTSILNFNKGMISDYHPLRNISTWLVDHGPWS